MQLQYCRDCWHESAVLGLRNTCAPKMRRLEFIWAHHLRDRPFVLDVVQSVTLMVLRAVCLRLWTRRPFVLNRWFFSVDRVSVTQILEAVDPSSLHRGEIVAVMLELTSRKPSNRVEVVIPSMRFLSSWRAHSPWKALDAGSDRPVQRESS